MSKHFNSQFVRKHLPYGFSWETRINSNDIEVLSNHLQKELPNIVERAKGLHNLALNVFEAGLKECGWIAWEETQRANINVTRSQKGYDHLTFIEHFLGGKVSVGDINGDSHQKRRSECSNVARLQSTL